MLKKCIVIELCAVLFHLTAVYIEFSAESFLFPDSLASQTSIEPPSKHLSFAQMGTKRKRQNEDKDRLTDLKVFSHAWRALIQTATVSFHGVNVNLCDMLV